MVVDNLRAPMMHMNELEKRLDRIEQQLEGIANESSLKSFSYDSQVDLKELWDLFWQAKWWILGVAMLSAVAGTIYAYNLQNVYRSEGIYAPTAKESLGAIAGDFGGLAAMAGINLGAGGGNDVEQALALINSWPFLETVINKYNLKPYIFAAKGWDQKGRQLIWDNELYDVKKEEWIDKTVTTYDAYYALKSMMDVSFDNKKSLVRVSVQSKAPMISRDILLAVIRELNEKFRDRDFKDSERSVIFLQEKAKETAIAEMQAVIYQMLSTQMRSLMLASSNEEYLFRTVVEPKLAERPHGPKRKVIVVVMFLFGAIISMLWVFLGKIFMQRGDLGG
jgi:uncharacterized protein involved in exopolysaccharide biosynthesis